MLKVLIIIVELLIGIVLAHSDYCDPELCKIWNGTDFHFLEHIACDSNETISDNCPHGATFMKMTQRRKDLILDLHNAARNKIASGRVNGYLSARNMPILKWDSELEYLASLNVKTCQFEHDSCRNTFKYPYSGQNIGISWQSPPFRSNTKRIKIIVGSWFNEHKDANQSYIDSYDNHPEGRKIGHFTMMVADRAKRVGCAAIRFSHERIDKIFLMTCNYDYNSIFTEAIYQIGETAANCTSSKINHKYSGLCDWEEEDETSEESAEIDNELEGFKELL